MEQTVYESELLALFEQAVRGISYYEAQRANALKALRTLRLTAAPAPTP